MPTKDKSNKNKNKYTILIKIEMSDCNASLGIVEAIEKLPYVIAVRDVCMRIN